VFAACDKTPIPPENITNGKSNGVKKSSTLEEEIKQIELELEQKRKALKEVEIQRINLTQDCNRSKSNIPSARSNREETKGRYTPTHPPGAVLNEDSTGYKSDDNVPSPPAIQRTPPKILQKELPDPERIDVGSTKRESDSAPPSSLKNTPQGSPDGSIDGCDGSVEGSFRATENALDASFDEILRERVESSPSEVPSEVLQDDDSQRELHVATPPPFNTPRADSTQTPQVTPSSEEMIQRDSKVRLATETENLEIREKELRREIERLEQKRDELKRKQQ